MSRAFTTAGLASAGIAVPQPPGRAASAARPAETAAKARKPRKAAPTVEPRVPMLTGSVMLALDPSSTCTGFAFFGGSGALLEFGRFKPPAAHDANDRIAAMLDGLRNRLGRVGLIRVVIEDTSGKVGRRHGGGGAGLAVHGKAVGAFWRECVHAVGPAFVHMVPENVWTRGRTKAARQATVTLRYGFDGYDPAADDGGDVADAIGLASWWLAERAVSASPAGRDGTEGTR